MKDLQKSHGAYIYGPKPVEEFREEAIEKQEGSVNKLEGLLGDKDWFASKLTYIDLVIG